jgi:hypothetical protein
MSVTILVTRQLKQANYRSLFSQKSRLPYLAMKSTPSSRCSADAATKAVFDHKDSAISLLDLANDAEIVLTLQACKERQGIFGNADVPEETMAVTKKVCEDLEAAKMVLGTSKWVKIQIGRPANTNSPIQNLESSFFIGQKLCMRSFCVQYNFELIRPHLYNHLDHEQAAREQLEGGLGRIGDFVPSSHHSRSPPG